MTYTKPLPAPDALTAPFWEAAKRHEFRLQYCTDCARFQHPPTPRCPRCMGAAIEWREVSGRGKVHCYGIVYHKGGVVGYEDDVPYTAGLVELDEQDLLFFHSNVIDCEPKAVRIGLDVRAVFHDVTPDTTLIRFAPRSP